MATVELMSLKKDFGAHPVVKGVDLSIADGEFVALVGPSGCGKSTLLRVIAGLEEVTSGDVVIGTQIVNDLNPRERNIAMVFQSYALYPHMTVAENMAFSLKLSGQSTEERTTRINEAARMLNLTALLDRKPSQLSGGQRQRVAMGRAVVRKPDVFLFDEPLSNLDAQLRVQMRAEIKALHQKVGTTSIYVTHDQIEAMTLADRIVVLNAGKIEQQGSPLDLYLKPANRFVAGFIGSPSMNFLDGTVEAANGGLSARLEGLTSLPLPKDTAAKVGQRVSLGLRPEHLDVAGEGYKLSGPVTLVEPTGAQTHVVFTVAGKPVISVINGIIGVAIGDTFSVNLDPAKVHVFDAETGVRL